MRELVSGNFLIEFLSIQDLNTAAEDTNQPRAGKLPEGAGHRFPGAPDALGQLFLGELQGICSEPGGLIQQEGADSLF